MNFARKALTIGVLGNFAYNSNLFLGPFHNNAQAQNNHFDFGVHMIPHPKKAYKGGEDAFYADQGLLAVADGVGGWADHGVDPGLYSKELCSNIGKLWLKNTQLYQKSPKKLIIASAALSTQTGSSTCCVLTIDPKSKVLRTSYIGDSGYLIYRKQGLHYEPFYISPEHTRSFNFPYQIGTNGDDPKISLEKSHEVETGDFIIVATDGLLDNLSEIEMKNILNKKGKGWERDLTGLAKELAEEAFTSSQNRRKTSPFQIKAKQHGLYYPGGKPDDITVIAALIKIL